MLTMETVRKAIERYTQEAQTKPKDAMDKLYKDLDISVTELCMYQEKKSIAFMEGHIDEPLAQFLYQKLNSWENTTLPERITLTQVFVRIMRH